ncbi:2-octaprenyl-6-methoxyphenol hydroxylase /2-octaprenyl-3-methyl-6-methoxy-1,4-benzoquinol hydroxylase [Thalassolituus maritimus]|uniref:2-octaprenyl-6-methoxyphenol hydroxylase /2-octaprenyl-3-methyl-6-methoxy-1,4-benzoquinol hydroxylase n=1 Tax=Thalassolituus maritimus TaxID=484498 RepID=A0A1N7JKQ7_9GAMM|nr:2-octaprenyl-6-methoxyphenyl hydroxylase [Thalassolituus maritimus]SIS49952.1 2-octaprenyl-6-methoxyphenol hydroxylase /2-octaprenyl-3-methyl-6-methoxy-1,4-benzoquinol hydroxylase [Thalassolituus maritimus]
MSTDNSKVDITIIGAGMAGASLVHLLAPARAAGLSIALIDRQPLSWDKDDSDRPPSFDGRATALSWGTRQILEELDIWNSIAPYACSIDHIQVSDEGRFGQAQLHANEQNTEALGYIIENHRLGQGLLSGLNVSDSLHVMAPNSVETVRMTAEGAELKLDNGRTLTTQLLIMADGGRSPLPRQLGIEQSRKDYGAQALVTQVKCEKPHDHWAYERFSSDGPIAFLPLNNNEYAVVWTLNNDEIDDVLALADDVLIERLQARIGYRVGKISAIGERLTYPLALVKSSEQVRRSLVLLGNAAHSLHPVAGQGFNLTLRDAAVLAEHLNRAAMQEQDVGSLDVLEAYLQQQSADQRNTIAASDLLPRIFGSKVPAVALLRDAGLLTMAAAPVARRLFARHAMGLGHTAAKLG